MKKVKDTLTFSQFWWQVKETLKFSAMRHMWKYQVVQWENLKGAGGEGGGRGDRDGEHM